MGTTTLSAAIAIPSPPCPEEQPSQLINALDLHLPKAHQPPAEKREEMLYTWEDISRVLPHKRYYTKAGAGYVMCMTLKEAFTIFKAERPDADVKFMKFTMFGPENVRLVGQVHPETYTCVYCLNVRHKKDAINKILTRAVKGPSTSNQLPPEVKMLDFLLCDKKEGRE
ncbi:hypothetical protein PoB_001186000 [Plakobranchus ocellatus]|uniref:Uncharacterized protein n=1 Tax=Plakobranchus ocellatus TaxID=259542 RepID=A0AAV3YQD6_9GAST|nr:hypothetical protein PoB_001186000 [Plakobranchus ocellatus]